MRAFALLLLLVGCSSTPEVEPLGLEVPPGYRLVYEQDFGTPETWGKGNRAAKLRAEADFANPPSDGHMTGFAVLVLREAGIPASDPRIRKAVHWIKANQRESGRWWTRSLNTDKFHFVTYSGTCYPLLALAHCNAL